MQIRAWDEKSLGGIFLVQESEKKLCLVFADNPESFRDLEKVLKDRFELHWIKDGLELGETVKGNPYRLIICEPRIHNLKPDDLINFCQMFHPAAPLLVLSDVDDQETAKWALHNGVFNMLMKPLDEHEVLQKVKLAEDVTKDISERGLSEQDVGHIYNLLKSHYYELDDIFVYIKRNNIPLSIIRDELRKKERFGKCLFDFIAKPEQVVESA